MSALINYDSLWYPDLIEPIEDGIPAESWEEEGGVSGVSPLLARNARSQDNGAFCGLASAVCVLNAAREVHLKTNNDDARVVERSLWTQADLYQNLLREKIVRDDRHMRRGLSLQTVHQIIEKEGGCFGATSVLFPASESRATFCEAFEKALGACYQVESGGLGETLVSGCVVVNFWRQCPHRPQDGKDRVHRGGHIAPVGAYNRKERRILILEPNDRRFAWHWIDVDHMVSLMMRPDGTSKKPRGFIAVEFGAVVA